MSVVDQPKSDSSITIEASDLLGCFRGEVSDFVYQVAKHIAQNLASSRGQQVQKVIIERSDVESAGRKVLEAIQQIAARDHLNSVDFSRSLKEMEQCFNSHCEDDC